MNSFITRKFIIAAVKLKKKIESLIITINLDSIVLELIKIKGNIKTGCRSTPGA